MLRGDGRVDLGAMDSKVLTIMFTDIKGFTQTTGNRSREGMLDLVKRHDKLLRPIIEYYEGRVVKTIGDAFLVVFESPTNAVLCGMLMQHTLHEFNQKAASDDAVALEIFPVHIRLSMAAHRIPEGEEGGNMPAQGMQRRFR